jgi:hypothetical protein
MVRGAVTSSVRHTMKGKNICAFLALGVIVSACAHTQKTYSGRVVYLSSSKPVYKAKVRLMTSPELSLLFLVPRPPKMLAESTTDSEGNFTLQALCSGRRTWIATSGKAVETSIGPYSKKVEFPGVQISDPKEGIFHILKVPDSYIPEKQSRTSSSSQ